MMLKLVITIGVVAAALLIGEYLWRVRHQGSELTRKFVHISVGSFVAFWPFFLDWNTIRVLSVAFIVGVLVSQYLKLFKAIHSVTRPTHGELFFALAAPVISFITHDKWIFMAALLTMSLADGLAAVLGTKYGRTNRYKVFGHTKSWTGTGAFFVIALIILMIYGYVNKHLDAVAVFAGVALGATVIENAVGQGLDNLLVPVLVAVVLRLT